MAVEVPLSREAEQALMKYPDILRMLERFVCDQAEYYTWRESQETSEDDELRALVRRGLERGRKRRAEGASHEAAVRRIMEIREETGKYFLSGGNA